MKHEKKYLFDDPKNIKRVLHLLYGCCTLLLILDFVIHRHISHSWESLWGFYPIYGFVGCVILVLVATWMRTFLMRDEGYYDNEGMDNEGMDGKTITNQDDASQKVTTKIGDHHVDD